MSTDRGWMQEIARLRARAAKVRRRTSSSAEHDEVLDSALETCEGLLRELAYLRAENETLTRRCDAENATYAYLFDHLPIAAVETDRSGLILTANRAASLVLNTSTKHLMGRVLLHFAEDREGFINLLSVLLKEKSEYRTVLRLRPRERAPLPLTATVIPSAPHEPSTLIWFLSPALASTESATRRDLNTAVEA